MAEISGGDYQQKAKQNAREDNASFMFTESQLNEDDDAAQSTSALVTSNNDVYLSNKPSQKVFVQKPGRK